MSKRQIRDYGECKCGCHLSDGFFHCFGGDCCERSGYQPERIKAWIPLLNKLHKLYFDGKLQTKEAYDLRNSMIEPWNNLIDYEREMIPRRCMRSEVAEFIWGPRMNKR